jgi:uncharacterized protein (DUF1330 family)
MKNVATLFLTLLTGIFIGAWGVPILKAQTAAGPDVYVVSETRATDPAAFKEFVRREPATLDPYHGRILARALPDVREGAPANGIVTLIGFLSPQDANRWFNSPEYASLSALRQKGAASRLYIINGTR